MGFVDLGVDFIISNNFLWLKFEYNGKVQK